MKYIILFVVAVILVLLLFYIGGNIVLEKLPADNSQVTVPAAQK